MIADADGNKKQRKWITKIVGTWKTARARNNSTTPWDGED